MGHLEKKLEWCLKKAKKEGEKHRGLKEVESSDEKVRKHIAKADHNLRAMNYLIKGNYPDWAVSASFYAMYHCLLAVLAKYNYESRNQECTLVAVESLIKEKKLDIDVGWLRKIAIFDDQELVDEEIIKLREEFQYGIGTSVEEDKIRSLVRDTTEFIDIVKEVLKK